VAAASLSRARGFIDFVNKSPSPFHAVSAVSEMLTGAGFTQLSEKDSWKVAKTGKYFVTRNNTAIIAFVVGGAWDPATGGFTVTAAHTDSPCVRCKPISKRSAEGLALVGSEWYGGLLAYTWFDRDLSVAGRVLVKRPDGSIASRLVNVPRPILRIPSLAIHLNRKANEAFEVNKERHLNAVFASEAKAALDALERTGADAEATAAASNAAAAAAASSAAASSAAAAPGAPMAISERHHPRLLELLAKDQDFAAEDIVDFELCMYDTHAATLGGPEEEFVFAPRLDNLLMSYCCTQSLIGASGGADGDDASLAGERNVRIVGLFDNEEVGSSSVPGAGSTFLEHVLRRVTTATPASDGCGTEEAFMRAVRRSVLVSADMAHAAHPNYPEKHETLHRPKMNCGLVIKNNTNQRYATTSVTATMVRKAAEAAGAPVQEFVMRQDMGCGSTIGPILSTSLGMRTVDVGVAQLAMHSIREMCGSYDIESTVSIFESLYRDFRAMDDAITGTD